MDNIRGLISAVCMCAVLNAGVRLLSPGKLQKEMRIVCTLMLIICAAGKLSGGFTADLDALVSKETARQTDFADSVLAETEHALAAGLSGKLESAGIYNAEIGIVCAFDEYNYVRAEKVTVRLHGGGENELRAAISAAEELFPGAETEVTAS